MHHNYMIALSALFLLVFAVMLHSMATHRRASAHASPRFSGPTGSSQWIWATIPLLILGMVNVALFRDADRHTPAAKIEANIINPSPPTSPTFDASAIPGGVSSARFALATASSQAVLR